MTKTIKPQCSCCYKRISAGLKAGIAHYKQFHPLDPEFCFRQFGQTWDETLTRIVRSALEIQTTHELTLKKLNETIKLLENENRMRNVLATKLNGIIMILKSDAQPASKDGVA